MQVAQYHRLVELEAMKLDESVAQYERSQVIASQRAVKSVMHGGKIGRSLDYLSEPLRRCKELQQERDKLRTLFMPGVSIEDRLSTIARERMGVDGFSSVHTVYNENGGLEYKATTHDNRSMTIKIAIE